MKIELTKKEFKTLMEVYKATSKEEVRPILQHVNFNNGTVAALDGYRLMTRKSGVAFEGDFNIHRKDIKSMLDMVKKEVEYITLSIEETFRFTTYNKDKEKISVLNGRLTDGNFIKYQSLIPQYFNTTITVDPKEVLEVIKPLKKNETCLFNITKENLNIKDIESYKKAKGKESMLGKNINKDIKCITKNDDIEIAYNNTYIKDSLKNYKEHITIKFTDKFNPTIITNNDGTKLDLILPVRLIGKFVAA